MAELESLVFSVDTTQLDTAQKKVNELATSVAGLEQATTGLSNAEANAIRTATEITKAKAEQTRANTALAKAEDAAAKAIADAAKAAEAAAAGQGQASNSNKKAQSDAEKLAKLIQNLGNTYGDLGNNMTRGESSIMNFARVLGASATELEVVKEKLKQIGSLTRNPFDASLGAVRSVSQELAAMKARVDPLNASLGLTTKQLAEYSRLSEEAKSKVVSSGLSVDSAEGIAKMNQLLTESKAAYIAAATELNALSAAERIENAEAKKRLETQANITNSNNQVAASALHLAEVTALVAGGMSKEEAQMRLTLAARGVTVENINAQISAEKVLTNVIQEQANIQNAAANAEKNRAQALAAETAAQQQSNQVNNQAVDSLVRLSELTAMVTSGMSKQEAEFRLNNREKGISKELTDNQIAAEKALTQAVNEQTAAKRVEQQQLTNGNSMMDAATQAYYRQRDATNAASTSLVDYITKLREKTLVDSISEKYIKEGASRSTAKLAAKAEIAGVPQSDIKSMTDQAAEIDRLTRANIALANAGKTVEDIERRIAAALNVTNQGLNQQSTDTLVKYTNALNNMGLSAAEVSTKVEAMKNNLAQVAGKERAQQLNHLSRSISTQMGDVGISLAGGQNPLLVMIQQGDQIRGAIEMAGAKGKELQAAMNNASTVIANGFKNTAIAVGGFTRGAVEALVKAVAQFPIAAKDFVQSLYSIYVQSDRSFGTLRQYVESLRAMTPALTVVAAGLAMIAVAAYQTTTAQRELNTALQLNGAMLGITTEEASAYARAIDISGVTSNKATEALTLMVNAGIKSKESIVGITQVALELEKYGGVAVEKTAAQYASLGKDTLKVLAEVGIETGYVTEETLKQVDALIKVGDKQGAVELATQSMESAHRQAIDSMKAQLTPFGQMLEIIKGTVADIWQTFIDLGKSTNLIYGLKVAWAAVAAPIILAAAAVKTFAIASKVDSKANEKIKNLDFAGAKAVELEADAEVAKVWADMNKQLANLNLTGEANNSTTAEAIKLEAERREEQSKGAASFDAVHHAMDQVNKKLLEQGKKTMSLTEYQAAYRLEILKTANAHNKTGSEVKFTTEELAKQDKVSKQVWEDAQKKPKKGTTPREVLNKPSNVDLQENRKSYESAIRLAEEFGKNERAILKNSYEAGLVERGAYIARDLALIIAGEQQRRQAIEAETVGLTEDYEKKRTALEAEAKRLKSSTLKGAPEQYQKVERALSDLSKQQETFNVLQGDKTSKLENEINLRYSETLKESNLAMVALNKEYKDFIKKQEDLAAQRKDQIASANTLMTLTGAEAAAYKSGADAVKQMTDELSKFKNDAKEADKVFSDFIANTKPDFDNEAFLQRYMLLLEQKQNAAAKVDEAIAKSGEYVEKAKTDAVTMYYQEEVKRISEGLSGVLTTAVFDGGEAGAKALRSFIEQELRKKFMIEVQASIIAPLVNQAFTAMGLSVGNVASATSTAVSGIQTAGSVASAAGTIGGAASAFGGAFSAGAALGTEAFGAGVTMMAEASGMSSFMAGAGQALGAIGPVGWAAMAAITAGALLSGGETRSGSRYETTAQGAKRIEGPSGGAINRYTEEQLNKQAFTSINSFLKNIGSKDFLTQFVSGIETSDNGKGGAFAGGTLSSGAKFGDTQSASTYQFNENLSADDAMKRYTEEMNKVTIAALQAATDIPEYIAKSIADLDVEKLTAEQADAVVKDVQEMFTAMKSANKYMRDFGGILFETTEKGSASLSLLTSEFGGLEQFNSAMQIFSSLVSSPFQQALSNYTELKSAIDGLGIELPYSAEGIRQLTNSFDLNTEAGRKAYASTIQAGNAMIQAGDALLQTIGTSTEQLASIIVEGMRNGDPAGAGQYFADTVVYGIENALYQNMGSQITQIVTNGIITPLMQSMLAGSTAAEAISKLSIAGITSQVQQVTTFFKDLFTNPEFIKIMDMMKIGLAGVLTGFTSDIPAPRFNEPVNPWKETDKAAKDAADAAKKAAEEWAKLLESLNDRKLTAQIKNIYLTQGNAAGLAAERTKELAGLTKDLSSEQASQVTSIYKSIIALEDLNKGLEDLTSSFSSALGSLSSSAQKESAGYVEVIKTLAKYGISADKQTLLKYSNSQLLEFIGTFSQMSGISVETRAEIIKTVTSIGELNTAFRSQSEQTDNVINSLLSAQGQNYKTAEKAVQVLSKLGTTIPKTTTELRSMLSSMSATQSQTLSFTDSLVGLVPAMQQLEKSVYAVFGLTEDTITGVIQGILTGETKGIAAGQALGDAVYNGIKSVIATTGSQAVAQVFMQYILNPIVQAMLAGSTLSEAMNSVDVAGGIKTAKDVASVYKEILGSTDIQQFAQIFFDAGNSMAETSSKSSSSFTDLESTLLGSDKAATSTVNKIDTLTSSITSLGNAAKSAVPQAPVKAPIPQETLPADVVKTTASSSTAPSSTETAVVPQGDPALIVEQLKAYFATAPTPLEIYKGIKETGVSYDLIAQALGTTTDEVSNAVKSFAETVVSTRSTNTSLDYLNAAGEIVKSVLKEQPSQPVTSAPIATTTGVYQPSGGYIPNRDLAGEEQKRNEGLQLQADLLRLQNKEQEALAIEYQLATASMQPLVRALYDQNLALQKQIAILTQRKELESELLNLLGNTTELRKRELQAIDESNRSLKQLIWNLEDTKAATDKALENLKTLSDKQIAELEKTFVTTDNAYSALERALEAQKKAAEKQVEQSTTLRDNLKSIFDFLKTQVSELRGEVDQTKLMQAAEGRKVISNAVTTGVIPEQKLLEEAVGAARKGVEEQFYVTKFDRDRSYLLLANELDSLKNVVDPQLTDAEKALQVANLQLANSDELLKKYKDQIDVMRGVDISVIGVDAAVSKLESAIQAEASARDQITEIKRQVELAQKQYDSLRGLELGVTTMTQAILDFQNAVLAEMQATGAAKKVAGGAVVNQDLGVGWLPPKIPSESYTLPSGTPETAPQPSVHSTIVAGWSYSQFAEAAAGIASGTLAEAGTPVYEAIINDPRWTGAYAGGGNYPGGMALVGEEGPELINFDQPGQIFTANQTKQALGTDNSELVDEIRNLREENKAQAGAIVRLQSQMLKLISRWDGNGLPETRTNV